MKKQIILSILLALGAVSSWATTYYSTPSVTIDPANVANWWTVNTGTGSHPANFTTSGDVFQWQATSTDGGSSTWTLGSGVNLTVLTGGTLARGANAISVGGTTTCSGNAKITSTAANTFTGNFSSGNGLHTTGATTFGGDVSTGSGKITISGNSTIAGTLTIPNNGQFVCGASTLSVTGTTTISGTGKITGTGANTFTGAVSITGTGANTSGATTFGNNVSVGDGTTVAALTLTGNSTIAGALSVGATGTLTISGANTTLGVTGTTTVNGTLALTGANGLKTFTGDVTLASTGTWNESGAGPCSFGGNLILSSSGTFTDGTGVHTFSGTSKQIQGTATSASIGSVEVTGSLTLGGSVATLTVGTALTGAGSFTLPANDTLNIGGTFTTTTVTLNNSGSTVNYTKAGTQTALATTYNNLGLSGTSAKTLTSITTVSGTLALSGSATVATGANALTTVGGNVTLAGTSTFAPGANLNITGSLTVGDGTTFSPGAFDLTVGTTTTVGGGTSGTMSVGSSTGTKTFTGDVTINSGATWNETAAVVCSFGGNLANSGTFTAGTGVHTFSGSSKSTTGTIAIPNLTLTGTYSVGSGLLVSGTLTLTSGGFTSAGNLSLGNSATISRAAGTLDVAPTFGTSVNVNYTSSGVTTGPELPASSSVLNDLTFQQASGAVTIGAAQQVNGTLSLTSGSVISANNLTLASGATITRATGSLDVAPTFGSTVNVTYTGSTPVTSGPEIPASASVLSVLTDNNTGTTGVTLGDNVTINGASTVGASAVLTIPGGKTFEIASAATLSVNASGRVAVQSGGILKNSGAADDITSTATTLTFASGAEYDHNPSTAGGTIPTAGWDANSTCNVIGALNGAPAGLDQSFGNLTWNCPNQSAGFNLAGKLTTINGNFTVANTGGNQLRLVLNQLSPPPLTIGGNLVLVGGTLSLSAGTGVSTVNVSGNVSVTAGSLTATTPGNGKINFAKSGTQTYTGGATINGIDWTVNSGSTLDIVGTSTMGGNVTFASGSTYSVDIGSADKLIVDGTLDITGATLALNGTIDGSGRTIMISPNNSISGTFSGLANGAPVPGQPDYFIHYSQDPGGPNAGQYSVTINKISGTTSAGIDLRAYQSADGVYVEFIAYDVEQDGIIQLQLLDANGAVVWTGEVNVTAGPQFIARFLVPGLKLGESYNFRVIDEAGKLWQAPGVTVGSFDMAMTGATLAGVTRTFDSLPGRDYAIQWTGKLGETWQTVTNLTASEGKTSVIVEYPESDGSSGFFRVQAK